jgi:DNA-binding Lrp family transcriptional regulator
MLLSVDDRRLLRILSEDTRITPEELSKQTRLSVDYINKKLRQWEQDKVIAKYNVLINWDLLGEERVTAMIDVKICPQRGHGYDKIAKRLQRFPEIQSVFLLSGNSDLCLIIEGKNMNEIAQFVSDKLSPLELVESTSTRFIMRRYKQDGVEFFGEEKGPERLMFTP